MVSCRADGPSAFAIQISGRPDAIELKTRRPSGVYVRPENMANLWVMPDADAALVAAPAFAM